VSDGSITSGISRLEVISSDGGRPSINAVIDALFIAVSVRVVFALVWGIYFLYPIKGHDGLGSIVGPFGDAFAGPLHEGQVAMG
jgi:hypothetical protein